jgi:choline dehydrogenase
MGRVEGPGADPLAVVDAELRVRGVTGLRIADAGVMPVITSGNTNAPTLMIAERLAALLRQSPT